MCDMVDGLDGPHGRKIQVGDLGGRAGMAKVL